MRKNLLLLVVILLVAILAGGSIGWYILFGRPKRDVVGERAALITTSKELAVQFIEHPEEIDEELHDKVIELLGHVTSTEVDREGHQNLFLAYEDVEIQVSFLEEVQNIKALKIREGDNIRLKGNYTGYKEDDLLGIMLIKLNNGYILNSIGTR